MVKLMPVFRRLHAEQTQHIPPIVEAAASQEETAPTGLKSERFLFSFREFSRDLPMFLASGLIGGGGLRRFSRGHARMYG